MAIHRDDDDDDYISKYFGKSIRQTIDSIQKMQQMYDFRGLKEMQTIQNLVPKFAVFDMYRDQLAPLMKDKNSIAIDRFIEAKGFKNLLKEQDLRFYIDKFDWHTKFMAQDFRSPVFDHIADMRTSISAMALKPDMVEMFAELETLSAKVGALPPCIKAVYDLKFMNVVAGSLPEFTRDLLEKAQQSIDLRFASNFIRETTCFLGSDNPPLHIFPAEEQTERLHSAMDAFRLTIDARAQAVAKLESEKQADEQSFEITGQILALIAQKVAFADEAFACLMSTAQALDLKPEERMQRLEQILTDIKQKKKPSKPN